MIDIDKLTRDAINLTRTLVDEYGLSNDEVAVVSSAVICNVPIEIDGIRNRPIGKSHLCDFLRSLGADAFETYETEEGGRDRRKRPDANTNHAHVYIWLGVEYRGVNDD